MLSHKNLATNAQSLMEAWQYSPKDRLLHALPIFHIHGLFVAGNLTFLSGASMIFLPRFDLDGIINCLGQATTMMGVPTFYTRLLNDPRFTQSLVGHMRLFVSGSAPLLAETHRRFEERTGHKILERYGMTETNMTISNFPMRVSVRQVQSDSRCSAFWCALPIRITVCRLRMEKSAC